MNYKLLSHNESHLVNKLYNNSNIKSNSLHININMKSLPYNSQENL